MRIVGRVIFSLIFCSCTLSVFAQTSRGVMSAPDLVAEPAKGVYEDRDHTVWLYSFCVNQSEGFPTLSFADEDGRRVEQQVRSLFRFAYDVQTASLPENPYERTKAALLKLLSSAVSAARDGDVVLLYFSGHGILASNPYVRDEYYFIPADVNPGDPQSTALSGAEIRQYIGRMVDKGALVLVFVDTCHSEALFPESAVVAGKGGVGYFASSSKGAETMENSQLGSTLFSESLVGVLGGNGIPGDLSVADLAESLGSPAAGNVKPKLFNAQERILLHSVNKKKEYYLRLERYKDYISEGRAAILRNDYSRASSQFYEARHLERGIVSEDRADLSGDIMALNRSVAEAAGKKTDDPVWNSLASLAKNSHFMDYFLDEGIVDRVALYRGCGDYFYRLSNYREAYGFFEKAFAFGERKSAPYHMAKIAESYLKGRLGKEEVAKYYALAERNGYDSEENQRARCELLLKAESGDVRSQYLVGRGYFRGDTLGFAIDSLKAVKWLTRASDAMNPNAIRLLGHCYRDGIGVPRDARQAYRLYKRSASAGSLLAEYYAASLELTGTEGVKQNTKRAIKTMIDLSDRGLNEAKSDLGYCYYYGRYVKKDTDLAEQYWLQAANAGDADAQYYLGHSLGFGEEFRKDEQQALYWINKAIDQNNPSALCTMGQFHKYGVGVEKNDSLAFQYYMKAADRGDAEAFRLLGTSYFEGTGVEINYDKAEYWMKRAAWERDDYREYLGDLYYDIGRSYLGMERRDSDMARDYKKGFQYLSKAESVGVFEKNVSGLQYALARCYSEGLGAEKDEKKAMSYFLNASERGHAASMNSIGVLYYYGSGVDEDVEKASEWFNRAEEAGNTTAAWNLGQMCLEQADTLGAKEHFMKAGFLNVQAQEWLGDFYYYGYSGNEVSYTEAEKYYSWAYGLGDRSENLINRLGWIYCDGLAKDWNAGNYESAFEWCNKAMDIGYPDAWYYRALFSLYGKCVEQDTVAANEFYAIAYEKGARIEELSGRIEGIYTSLFKEYYDKKDYKRAFEYSEKAVKAGSVGFLFWMGYFYEKGFGVDVDLNKALEYYEKAYHSEGLSDIGKKNLSIGYYDLFVHYSNATGNYKKALEFCERAVELGSENARQRLFAARKKAKQEP